VICCITVKSDNYSFQLVELGPPHLSVPCPVSALGTLSSTCPWSHFEGLQADINSGLYLYCWCVTVTVV